MLTQSTLKTELENLTPTGDEALARSRFSAAWATYFSQAGIAGTPCAEGSLTSAQSAMEAAMVGVSGSGQGATKIQAGVVAFWGQVALQGATIWPGTIAPYTPPPTLSSLAGLLLTVFSANCGGSKSLGEAVEEVATVLHNNGGLGGTGTVPGVPPVTTPTL
jgi:hypothetical protein